MRPDAVVRLGKTVVQHGPANDRVYILKLDKDDLPEVVDKIYALGRDNGYSKLFAKVPSDKAGHFTARGFIDEARVPGMYKGEVAGYFMSKYLDQSRAIPRDIERITKVLECADQKSETAHSPTSTHQIQRLATGNAQELAELYDTVFESYPFPVNDPGYLKQMMEENVIFYGIFQDENLVAAASAEMDKDWACVEMTDFATLPAFRGKGAAGLLLAHMEKEMPSLGIQTAFTIARAESYGMNIVFARAGYAFGGTLHNNTQIGGKLESMNVWYKQIGTR
ncbi:putative beta-lysine N-acetyltransferase [Pseudodesulfovibrio senegalensis]|uniref:Putative beta-lysine N-acetyltransferase n=1 Tax=Pseudodesulfovibrio senegalensis TaxID=1721087 RepID=A0A6N6N649_9BACT|nr:putative beta-lysine N-acetyltransferase [Pseudodesulfovibrio senegalensis]KAB1443544.1 putative beta-lysine N-acetyltransferase [Pseudodesulfovibrio senegalensis]